MGCDLRQAKVQHLGVAALGDESVLTLDVAMDNRALCVQWFTSDRRIDAKATRQSVTCLGPSQPLNPYLGGSARTLPRGTPPPSVVTLLSVPCAHLLWQLAREADFLSINCFNVRRLRTISGSKCLREVRDRGAASAG